MMFSLILALNLSSVLVPDMNPVPSPTPVSAGNPLQYVPSGNFSHLRAELLSPAAQSLVDSNRISMIRIRAQGAPAGAILVVILVAPSNATFARTVLQLDPSQGNDEYVGVMSEPLPKGQRFRVRLIGYDKPCDDATDFPSDFRVCHPGPPPVFMVANQYYDIGEFATAP